MRELPCERSAPRLPCASNGRRSCRRRAYTYQPTFFYRRCKQRSQFARPSIAWAGVVLFHQGGRISRRDSMILTKTRKLLAGAAAAAVIIALGSAYAQQRPPGKTSYIFPVDIEPFPALFARLSAQKPDVTREHMAVLNERYDLSNRPAPAVTMDRTKPVQEGVRVKLPAGKTWEALANMSPEQLRHQAVFPNRFYPL